MFGFILSFAFQSPEIWCQWCVSSFPFSAYGELVFDFATSESASVFGQDTGKSLEKEMATHSSIIAWKIPWTEEPGRLYSWGHKELGRTDWAHVLASPDCVMPETRAAELPWLDITLKLRGKSKSASSYKPHDCFSKDTLVQCWEKTIILTMKGQYASIFRKKIWEMIEHSPYMLGHFM